MLDAIAPDRSRLPAFREPGHAVGELDPELRLAFTRTEYQVWAPNRVDALKIGASTPLALARCCRGRCWAIVTARNPGASRSSQFRNRRADQRLVQRLQRLRPSLLWPTAHRDPSGHWPEERGWLFCPATLQSAVRIGREFGQMAVVLGRPGRPIEIAECFGRSRHNARGRCRHARRRFGS